MGLQISRPTYLDIEDACAEVDITRRQLTHWEEQGLLYPELGRGSRKYTPTDLRRLKYLRQLIVEKKLPLSFLHDLLNAGQDSSLELIGTLFQTLKAFGSEENSLPEKVFDFESGRLEDRDDFANRVQDRWLAYATEEEIEEAVKRLVLYLLRVMKVEHRHPADFQDQFAEFLEEIRHLSRVARLDVLANAHRQVILTAFDPDQENDEPLDRSTYALWFLQDALLLSSMADIVRADERSGEAIERNISWRFWEEAALAGVEEDFAMQLEALPDWHPTTQEER